MIGDSDASGIIYSPYFTGVSGNYLRQSVINSGLDPENLPDRDKDTMSFGSTTVKAWRDVWGAGQGVGTIDKIGSAAEVIGQMRAEYQAAKKALCSA
jgi:nitronate monooxygenase